MGVMGEVKSDCPECSLDATSKCLLALGKGDRGGEAKPEGVTNFWSAFTR